LSELLTWLYPVAAVLAGYLVLGITGFGSALVIVPLLAWRWPLAEVVPLVLLLDVPASLLMGRLNLRLVHWSELRQLVPGMLLGGGLGLWLFSRAPSAWPLLALGFYVSWVGVRALRQHSVAPMVLRSSPWLGGLYGTGVGLVQVAFGTAGPLVLAWLARRRLPAPAVRASTPMIMAVVGAFVLLLFAVDGRLSTALMWQRTLVLFPVALAAVWVGHALAGRLHADRLRRTICALLVLSGGLLVVNALRQLL
jgi:uncharacterized protein